VRAGRDRDVQALGIREDGLLAFAMGLHGRLGRGSHAYGIGDDVMKQIVKHCKWQEADDDAEDLAEKLRLLFNKGNW